jgi:hypothetical protein
MREWGYLAPCRSRRHVALVIDAKLQFLPASALLFAMFLGVSFTLAAYL